MTILTGIQMTSRSASDYMELELLQTFAHFTAKNSVGW